jgi:hypothetical protein
MQNHVEQGLVSVNASVVGNVAKPPKAIHKVADTRSSASDHVGEDSLLYRWNLGCRVSGVSELSHEEQRSGETP